uniref:Uncharacterized protein n=1 Tax=Anguilla anguilla TaxID=7936 RepID=A0A0E9PUX2_ANGAN
MARPSSPVWTIEIPLETEKKEKKKNMHTQTHTHTCNISNCFLSLGGLVPGDRGVLVQGLGI